jgi:hypothetical protein
MDMFHTKITIEGGHGLIFTDIILGHIENPQSAVQKAGRLAGIIAQCPQYPGAINFWTDDQTACTVINHNRMVDEANRLSGTYSALQATTRALGNITLEIPKKQTTYEVSDVSFESLGAANDWYIENCSYMIKFKHRDGTETLKKYGKSEYGLYKKTDQDVLVECSEPEATHIKYRGDARELQSEEYTRNCGDLGQGVKSSARIMPVRGENGSSIRYIVIYKAKPN